MEFLRLTSLVVFCVALFMLGEKWFAEYGPKPNPTAVESKGVERAAAVGDIPSPTTSQTPVTPRESPAVPASTTPAIIAGETVTLRNDVLEIQISTIGGDIRRAVLLKHGDTLDPQKPFVLLETGGNHTYLAQSGLTGKGLPNHKTAFTASTKDAQLAEGQNTVFVELTAPGADGASTVTKRYSLERGEYVLTLSQRVAGLPTESPSPTAYFQLIRDEKPPVGDSRWVPTYNGVAVYTEKDKYQKVSFEDIAKGKASHTSDGNDGWIGMVQHYFVSAWLPEKGSRRDFFTRSLDQGLYAAGVMVPMAKSSDGNWQVTVPLYVGPQEQEKLKQLADGLQLTVDYGWLTVIATPLFWLLSAIHKWISSNWGVTIILLTLLIKLAFFPLSAASYKSMAKMRVMGPKLQKLKEIHGDDRQKLHQAMMELYKTEKINPLGGCLPVLIQIPVFISLYWVLLGSVEMRQAPFVLWITDLSSPDPIYILPVLMGISMIIQSRLNPEPPDPIQAKVMKIMPVAFSVFFFFFPAGLVLYWLVNNILSIGQQWYITRQLETAGLGVAKR